MSGYVGRAGEGTTQRVRPAQEAKNVGTPTWKDVATRTAKRVKADNLPDRAATLTYYGILSIFPGALALVSILGLLGANNAQSLMNHVETVAPGSVHDFINKVVHQAQSAHTGAGISLVIAIVLAVWSASAYVAAFIRADNAMYGIGEGRPFWKLTPVRFAVTVAVMVMLIGSMIIVLVSGQVAHEAGKALGVGSAAVTAWNIAKWPVLVILVSLIFALLYWACPNVKVRGFRSIGLGGLFAVIVWVVASGLFAIYVANFSSYNKTYGALAGVIVFLVWMWISNLAILLGAALNIELERRRAIANGIPDSKSFVEPRDTRALKAYEQDGGMSTTTEQPAPSARSK